MSQKFHGIALANNSTADNFHFERLAADPVVVSAGRVWFNTAQKLFKFSGLDTEGNVTVNVFSSGSDMTATIAALQASLATEISDRTTAVSAETTARELAITTLTAALATEQAARIAADSVTASNASDLVNTETTARLAGDVALGGRVDVVQAELDTTQASVGLNVDGTFTAPAATTYLGTATSVKGATVLLDTALAAETTSRTTKDGLQDAALAAEVQLRIDGDAALQSQLTAYIDAAVTNNTNADNAETIRATTAETAIKAELDLTQASIGTAADGSLPAYTGTNYLDSATTIVSATSALDTQLGTVATALAAETTARAAANVSFNTSLQTEITDRTAADTALQTEINNIEAGAGLEANGLYAAPTGSNYLGTAISLKDADFILDSAIKIVDDKVTAAAATDLALQNAIDNLVAASGDGSVALKNTLNDGRFTYTSATPELEHVITHNLNTPYYLADIKVQGLDMVYRNDICPVEEIDNNSFRITLTEAARVKVGVMSLATII